MRTRTKETKQKDYQSTTETPQQAEIIDAKPFNAPTVPMVRARDTVLEMVRVQEYMHHTTEQKQAILNSALAELELCPELAEKTYYVIPFRTKTGGEVKVEGPGIHAARSLRRLWGNCAAQAVIVSEDEDYYIVEGRFVDAETNTMYGTQIKVSKYYVSQETHQKTPLRDDFLTRAVQAGMSKAERNATFACLPDWLRESYYQKARQIAASVVNGKGKKTEDIGERARKMYTAFEKLGVKTEMLDTYIVIHSKEGIIDTDTLADLLGIYNAIKDGQTTIDEVFGTKRESTTTTEGEIKKGDLL